MTHTLYARTLIGDSLGFHIIFALLGVGIPLLVLLVHGLGIYRKDEDYLLMARRWSFVMVVLFVTGALSGTIISFQFSTLWAPFMKLAGQVIGLPFYLEGIAFFIEAIFLGIYAYGWRHAQNEWLHWLTLIPILLAATASAFFITTANAFMNNPQGVAWQDGVLISTNPWQAMFNPATWTETSHSIISYYLTTALLFAGFYAAWLLRQRSDAEKKYGHKVLIVLLPLALILAILIGLTGDRSAKYLAREEPLKLAAAEADFTTQTYAPLRIGGVVDQTGVHGAITLPAVLSWLAFARFDAVVVGLDAFDPTLWPPLFVHYLFDLMVGIGLILTIIPAIFVIGLWRRVPWLYSKVMLWALIILGILSVLAVEAGWMLTEIGRQPYAIRGIMTTDAAFLSTSPVIAFAFIFPTLYLLLATATIIVLYFYVKHRPLKLVHHAHG